LRSSAKVREPLELSFEVVSGVGRGMGVLKRGSTWPKGKRVSEILFPPPIALGAWLGIFKPNAQNIQTLISWKLLHGFQPNFAYQ